MAIPKLREDGTLPPGRHSASLSQIKKRFVVNEHRQRVWRNFDCWLDEFRALAKPIRLWLGGSFLTDKNDANDIDVVVWVDPEQVDRARLASVLTHQNVYELNKDFAGNGRLIPISRIQPGNGRVDAFFANAGDQFAEVAWDSIWSTIFDKESEEKLGEKGYLEVTL